VSPTKRKDWVNTGITCEHQHTLERSHTWPEDYKLDANWEEWSLQILFLPIDRGAG
jgi:hypothetical protein